MFLLSRRVLKLIVTKIKIKEDKLGGEYCYTREDVIYDRTGHDFKHQLRIKIPLKKNIPPEIILQENEKEDTTKIKDELRKIKNQIIQEKEDYIKNYLYVNEKYRVDSSSSTPKRTNIQHVCQSRKNQALDSCA